MYPHKELRRLAARKAALVCELDRGRAEWNAAAARLVEPLALVERVVVLWRRLVPGGGFAAGSPADAGSRPASVRPSRLVTWLRLIPLVVGAVRVMRGSAARHASGARHESGNGSATDR
jgi:hypothetical protein